MLHHGLKNIDFLLSGTLLHPAPGGHEDTRGHLMVGAALCSLCLDIDDGAGLGPDSTAPARRRKMCKCLPMAQGHHLLPVQRLLSFGCRRATLHSILIAQHFKHIKPKNKSLATPPPLHCKKQGRPWPHTILGGLVGQEPSAEIWQGCWCQTAPTPKESIFYTEALPMFDLYTLKYYILEM